MFSEMCVFAGFIIKFLVLQPLNIRGTVKDLGFIIFFFTIALGHCLE